jgi:predicted small lipoprotein YifL
MLKLKPILVKRFVLAGGAAALLGLAACGQKGPLILPTEAAAAKRATLLQTLNPMDSPPTSATTAPPPQVPPNQLLMPPANTPENAPASPASAPATTP